MEKKTKRRVWVGMIPLIALTVLSGVGATFALWTWNNIANKQAVATGNVTAKIEGEITVDASDDFSVVLDQPVTANNSLGEGAHWTGTITPTLTATLEGGTVDMSKFELTYTIDLNDTLDTYVTMDGATDGVVTGNWTNGDAITLPTLNYTDTDITEEEYDAMKAALDAVSEYATVTFRAEYKQ